MDCHGRLETVAHQIGRDHQHHDLVDTVIGRRSRPHIHAWREFKSLKVLHSSRESARLIRRDRVVGIKRLHHLFVAKCHSWENFILAIGTKQCVLAGIGLHQRGITMLADDLIEGAEAAAAYIGIPERRARYLAEKGFLPVKRMGSRLYFRKSELDRAFSSEGATA